MNVVIVHSSTQEGAKQLLDCVCQTGELIPVHDPKPMLGRDNRWEAKAVPADEPPAPKYRAKSRLEYQIRRGHR